MAVISRAIMCISLTIILQFMVRQFYDSSVPSDSADFITLLCVITATLLILFWWQFSKMSAHQTRAGMALNPACFSPDKLDCYVRFQGQLAAENDYVLPVSGKACAFYQADVITEWETKTKKPGTGMETQRKILLRRQSSPELEISDGEQRIYLRTGHFTKSWLQLHKKEKVLRECPTKIQNMADKKYKTYQIAECFACNGDTITAQGKLTRHTDGRLFITPTGRLKFPSFVAVQRTDADQFAKEVAVKAHKDARIKQIYLVALVSNVLLLLYIFVTLQ